MLCYYSHFIDEETEVQGVKAILPKVNKVWRFQSRFHFVDRPWLPRRCEFLEVSLKAGKLLKLTLLSPPYSTLWGAETGGNGDWPMGYT